MKGLNLTTRDSSFKGGFNWNQIGVPGGKRPFKLSRLKISEQGLSLGADMIKFLNQSHKDQSFVQQGSIPAKRKILGKYSFKDLSFKDKD